METVVEIHSHYRQQIEIAKHVDWVYDFALPPLVLHAFAFRTARPLAEWLRVRPGNALTVLDTHDGIGIVDIGARRGDQRGPGLVPPHELDAARGDDPRSEQRARADSRRARPRRTSISIRSTAPSSTRSLASTATISWRARFSSSCPACRRSTTSGCSRATTTWSCCGAPASAATSIGTITTREELDAALQQPVVRNLCALIRLRNTHPAFRGEFSCDEPSDTELVMRWRSGAECAELRVDFASRDYRLVVTHDGALRPLDLGALAEEPEPSVHKGVFATSA